MEIQQKVFKLANESGNDLDANDELLLVINNEVTTIKVSELFKGYKQKPNSIVGWSLLSLFKVNDKYKLVMDGKEISFFNQTKGEQIVVKKIHNPDTQLNDKRFNPEDQADFNAKTTQPEPVIEETATETTAVETQPETEKVNAEYEASKSSLIELGYTELQNSEYPDLRLLWKEDADPYLVRLLPNSEIESLELTNIKNRAKEFNFGANSAKVINNELLINKVTDLA